MDGPNNKIGNCQAFAPIFHFKTIYRCIHKLKATLYIFCYAHGFVAITAFKPKVNGQVFFKSGNGKGPYIVKPALA